VTPLINTLEQAELLAIHTENYLEEQHRNPFQESMLILYKEVLRLREKQKE
jgi:hypothetical protein